MSSVRVEIKMKASIAGTLRNTLVNGPGIRYVVFFQGCSHHCPGCHNPKTWPTQAPNRQIQTLIEEIEKNRCLLDGITLSGGEPFEQPEAALVLAQYAKAAGLNVWAYTGYTYEELTQTDRYQALLQQIDVLVDGLFIQSLQDDGMKFKGSKNQRILSLKNGKVIKELIDGFDIW